MPPRKKARQPSRAASTSPGDSVRHTEKETPAPTRVDSDVESVTLDAWTDEQETSLFKSMIRWKPVGLSEVHHLDSMTRLITLTNMDRYAQTLPDDFYL